VLGDALLSHGGAAEGACVFRPRRTRSGWLPALVEPTGARVFREGSETFRYNHSVFIAPAWREIFQQDRERKQDFDEAVRTYEVLVGTYKALGYELIELPRVPVAERVRFVLQKSGLALPR
jgi:predicted ATPase